MKDVKNAQSKGFLWGMIGFLPLVTVISYISSLSYPFQFDDLAHITKKFAIRIDNPFSRWSMNSRWVGEWLNTMSFQIGKFDPFYYRLFSIFPSCSKRIGTFRVTVSQTISRSTSK